MQLKNLTIESPLFLAPMAGLTHTVLRRLIMAYGGMGLLSTEMLAATKLPRENAEISPYLVRSAVETPLSYQLLVCRVEDLGPAINALHGLRADAVDLNLGCPAPFVRRMGAGSKLMESPAKVRALVAEARRLTSLPLTAKIRLGEDLDEAKLRDFCLMLEGEGLDLLTVHARLRGEAFCRKPRWQWVGKVKEWLTIPVVANGGIFSVDDARKCLAESGADGLMIGRAAAIKPWLFAEIAREVYGASIPAPEVRLPVLYLEFVRILIESFLPERQLGRLKEFTHYFAKNYAFGHQLASAVQPSHSVAEARERALAFFVRNDPDNVPVGVDD
ncbi:MAG TPA: tRNA-dihydrouridine synthase family protein [Deltaproteobacteria bacterium]|nr:tRNA-dihydrouridine synthase family protein [Deltaproteobacteria bacterium]